MPVLPLVASMMVFSGVSSPCGLRRLDHGQGRAVLDGTAGIEIFQLDVDLHLRMGIEAVQADNGGLPDELQYVIGLAQHSGIRTPGVGGEAPY